MCYLKRKDFFFSIVKIYITVVIIIRETSGKLLTKAYGIVHNVGLLRLRVSLTFSDFINDKQK